MFREQGYCADVVHQWEFTIEPTSIILAKCESLRLEIASSAFPLYDRNPSTLGAPHDADAWNWKRSTQQVLHTAEYPSAIHLPVVEGGAW